MSVATAAHSLNDTKSTSQYVHDKWGADRGFIGGHVYAIEKSSDGYLWIGTQRGLVRYDGSNFLLIQRPIVTSGSFGPVRDIVSDHEGGLWIRGEGPHLLRYRDGGFEEMAGLDSSHVSAFSAICSGRGTGVILSGVGSDTLLYRNGMVQTAFQAKDVPGTIVSMTSTLDSAVWVASREGGLYRSRGLGVTDLSRRMAGLKIVDLVPANNGWLWVLTDKGVIQLGPDGTQQKDFRAWTKGMQVFALTVDHEGNTWIGTDHGLLRIAPSGYVSSDLIDTQKENEVTTLYLDDEGVLWYGGAGGIERLRDGTFTTYTSSEGLPPTGTGPVYVDNGDRTWFAPLTGGLYWLKQRHVTRVTASELGNDVVNSISGCNDEIWIGRQRGGLTALKVHETTITARSLTSRDGLAQDSVVSVHCSRDGSVWAGTASAGVSRLTDGRFKNFSMADGLSSNVINAIVEGHDGTMWFATAGGLDSYAAGHWTSWTTRNGLPAAEVDTIFEDSRKTLWIATSEGLAYLSSGQLRLPPVLPETLRERMIGITEGSRGSLWFATPDHVVQVGRDRLVSGSIEESDAQVYDATDGLLGTSEVRRDRSIVTDSTGQLWLALSSGLAVADTESVLARFTPVGVRITEMSVDGLGEDRRTPRRLAPGPRIVTFKYDAAGLSAPRGLRFRYTLDGYDQGWSDVASSRQVVYRNLGPGTYRFHVIASSGEGLWNGAEDSYSFTIAPAFWQTWWFRALCFTALIGTALLLYRLNLNRLTRQLNLNFQERLAERTRIARELHDTLLQSFQGLMLRFQAVERLLPAQPLEAKAALNGTLDRADQALLEGRDAIWNIRSSTREAHDLGQFLEKMIADLKQEGIEQGTDPVTFSVTVDGEPRDISPLLCEEICSIGREALRNSLLHAQPRRIETEITYNDSHLRLRFRDDGIGIDARTVQQGGRAGHWGIPGMQERARHIEAEFKLWSEEGIGTAVEVTLPARVAYDRPMLRIGFSRFRKASPSSRS